MHVQDALLKATHDDLDPAPRAPMGKPEPDEFDVDAHNVGAWLTIPYKGHVQLMPACRWHYLSSFVHVYIMLEQRTDMFWFNPPLV